MPVIGFLTSRTEGQAQELLAAIRAGLKETGDVEGQNVSIDYRFADNLNERLATLAADLVARGDPGWRHRAACHGCHIDHPDRVHDRV